MERCLLISSLHEKQDDHRRMVLSLTIAGMHLDHSSNHTCEVYQASRSSWLHHNYVQLHLVSWFPSCQACFAPRGSIQGSCNRPYPTIIPAYAILAMHECNEGWGSSVSQRIDREFLGNAKQAKNCPRTTCPMHRTIFLVLHQKAAAITASVDESSRGDIYLSLLCWIFDPA